MEEEPRKPGGKPFQYWRDTLVGRVLVDKGETILLPAARANAAATQHILRDTVSDRDEAVTRQLEDQLQQAEKRLRVVEQIPKSNDDIDTSSLPDPWQILQYRKGSDFVIYDPSSQLYIDVDEDTGVITGVYLGE